MAKKKKTSDNLGARLTLVMKSGKYSLGYKSTIKTLRSGKCKLVLIGTICLLLFSFVRVRVCFVHCEWFFVFVSGFSPLVVEGRRGAIRVWGVWGGRESPTPGHVP